MLQGYDYLKAKVNVFKKHYVNIHEQHKLR